MPFATDFALYLSGRRIESSKSRSETEFHFTVGDLEDSRIADLNKVTGETHGCVLRMVLAAIASHQALLAISTLRESLFMRQKERAKTVSIQSVHGA